MKWTVHAAIIAQKGGRVLALHILNGFGGLKSSGDWDGWAKGPAELILRQAQDDGLLKANEGKLL